MSNVTFNIDKVRKMFSVRENSIEEDTLLEMAMSDDKELKMIAAVFGTDKVLDLLKNEEKVNYYIAEQIALHGRDSDLKFIIDYKAPMITALYANKCNESILKDLIHVSSPEVRVAIIKRNEKRSVEMMLTMARGGLLFKSGDDHLTAYEFAKLGHNEFLAAFKTHPGDASAAAIFTKEKETLEFLAKEDIWCSNLAKVLIEKGDYIENI